MSTRHPPSAPVDADARLEQHEQLLRRLAQRWAELEERLAELEARLPAPPQDSDVADTAATETDAASVELQRRSRPRPGLRSRLPRKPR